MGVFPLFFTGARPSAQQIGVLAFVCPIGATGVRTAASGTLVALRMPETRTTVEGRRGRGERARTGRRRRGAAGTDAREVGMRVMMLLQPGPWWCPMCGPMGAWGWVMMGGMMVFVLAVLAAIVGGLWSLVRAAQRRGGAGGRPPAEPSAEDLLRRRYARGEVDRDTFLRMLDDLKRGPSP